MSDRGVLKDLCVKKATILLQSALTLSVPQAMGAAKSAQAIDIQYGRHFWRLYIYFDGQECNAKMDIVVCQAKSEYMI